MNSSETSCSNLMNELVDKNLSDAQNELEHQNLLCQ